MNLIWSHNENIWRALWCSSGKSSTTSHITLIMSPALLEKGHHLKGKFYISVDPNFLHSPNFHELHIWLYMWPDHQTSFGGSCTFRLGDFIRQIWPIATWKPSFEKEYHLSNKALVNLGKAFPFWRLPDIDFQYKVPDVERKNGSQCVWCRLYSSFPRHFHRLTHIMFA